MLTLIGSSLQIITTVGFFLTVPVMTYVTDAPYQFSDRGNFERQTGETVLVSNFGGIFFTFIFPYLAATILIFALEQYRKFVGAGLIILAFFALVISHYMAHLLIGTLVFAILLSAGILAIRFKPKMKESVK